MKKIAWIFMLIMAALTTQAAATDSHKGDDSDARCGNRKSFVRSDQLTIIALTADQRLLSFRECNPTRSHQIGSVYGLQASDTMLVGIDFRVQDGLLYGVGNGGGIYTIDTNTAVATMVTQLTETLDGDLFGVDFNPAANALRIISNTGQNLRHPFAGQLMFQTQKDAPLNYVPAATATGLTGAAYTNNDLDPNTGTTLFDIDTTLNQVVIQSPPNAGSLVAAGLLTVDADTPVGFDIYTKLQKNVAINNSGFASLVVGGVYGFYRVNFLTGQAFLIDYFGDAVIDIAIPLDQK
ncbi:MAG TPA: DUF4394 domain-containing protein [Candidatus Binatia bacterium]|nr:DUF4394 domain-containing protein [Candidatus Binatia bacterium]